jgi:16S rRNA (guanine527-N7)-methyltransferase
MQPHSAFACAAGGERLRAAGADLGLALDDARVERLLRFVEILHRWNATYNLTAVRDPADMLTQHVVDCLSVVAAMNRRLGGAPRRVIDVGSGGGLPGVVIAALRPSDVVTCVDAVGKKAAFVQQVALELGLPQLSARHGRVEAWRGPLFDVVTSRAFASLEDFVKWTRHLVAAEGCWMAMKGRHPNDELAALPADIDVFHVEHLEVPGLHAERCLVWMRRRA